MTKTAKLLILIFFLVLFSTYSPNNILENKSIIFPIKKIEIQNLRIIESKAIQIELDYLKIHQPSIFIGGEYDPVRFFIKNYDAYKDPGKYCEKYKGTYIIKSAGHWVQQEKPEMVNKIIKNFLINLT